MERRLSWIVNLDLLTKEVCLISETSLKRNFLFISALTVSSDLFTVRKVAAANTNGHPIKSNSMTTRTRGQVFLTQVQWEWKDEVNFAAGLISSTSGCFWTNGEIFSCKNHSAT